MVGGLHVPDDEDVQFVERVLWWRECCGECCCGLTQGWAGLAWGEMR